MTREMRSWVRTGGHRPGLWHLPTESSATVTGTVCGAVLRTRTMGRQYFRTTGHPMTGKVCSKCRATTR